MTKFSIIVPVYNTEKYLRRCLDSIKNQTFKDFECIIVNDGSTDNSINVIKKYLDDKRFILIDKENEGVSIARNFGVKIAKGDFLLFIDSDDYVSNNYLDIINNNLEVDLDVLKFGVKKIENDNEIIMGISSFEKINSKEAIHYLIKDSYIDTPVSYAFKRKFYNDNKFEFPVNKIHEDFGLIPLILYKAKYIKAIDNKLYIYENRSNSIMTSNSYDKKIIKFEDVFFHFKYLVKRIDNKELNSFIANTVINKLKTLNKKDQRKYIKLLNDESTFNYLLEDTFFRKVKKILYKINFIFFSKFF